MQVMAGNYWEETAYAASPLRELDRSDMSVAFNWLDLHFPVDGSKIAWRRVQGKHAHWNADDAVELVSIACREVCQRIRAGLVVEHVGDGLSPYGVRFAVDNAPSVVVALLEIPEHHYFIAEDRSWIVVVTTEGDVDVVDQM